MNKEFKKLLEQSYTKGFEECVRTGHKVGDLDVIFNSIVMGEFAELIVRECINIGDNYEEILGNEPECFNCRKVAYGIVDKIKNHFGVGE